MFRIFYQFHQFFSIFQPKFILIFTESHTYIYLINININMNINIYIYIYIYININIKTNIYINITFLAVLSNFYASELGKNVL